MVEDYDETIGHRRSINLNWASDLGPSLDLIGKQFGAILHKEPELRTKDVIWDMPDLVDPDSQTALETGLRRMWNGMRRLPFTNEEITESARSIASLIVAGFHARGPHDEAKAKAFANCFGNAFLVGLACDDGSSALAYASESALWYGVRPDLDEVLSARPGDLDLLFRFINDPRLLYKFEFVRDRFVREIIPSQIVHGNSHTVFNPAKLTMLGHP